MKKLLLICTCLISTSLLTSCLSTLGTINNVARGVALTKSTARGVGAIGKELSKNKKVITP